MVKLSVVTGYFDNLRDVDDGDEEVPTYTEKDIMKVLKQFEVLDYESVQDMPTAVVNDILAELTQGLCQRLNPNQEQEMLEFFEEILVNGKIELPIMAKSLRYLLRNDKSPKAALLIIDVQNDFISGSLPVPEGEQVVEVINNLSGTCHFKEIFYSLDWHPENHSCFHENVHLYELDESSPVTAEDAKVMDKVVYKGEKLLEQVLWPVHCIQDSDGAKLHNDLNIVDTATKIYKGQNPNIDSYSALWDNGRLSRCDLLGHLFDKDITHIFTCGLALDFCVGMTSVDAAKHGFDVFIIEDACRGIAKETIDEMKLKMAEAGCELIQAVDIPAKMIEI